MVPWLRFNLAEPTSEEEAKHSRNPTQQAPTLEEKGEETQGRGRSIVLETGTAKNELSRKLTRPSLRFQKTSS